MAVHRRSESNLLTPFQAAEASKVPTPRRSRRGGDPPLQPAIRQGRPPGPLSAPGLRRFRRVPKVARPPRASPRSDGPGPAASRRRFQF